MASLASNTPPYASPPFDDPNADLILRSSDGVDFLVLRDILRFASPVFADMVAVGHTRPQAVGGPHAQDDELRDGCPVVPVQEDSDTLDSLLRIVFPQEDPVLDDFPRLSAVLAAALKYDMVKATRLTGTKLRSFIPQKPLRAWAVAVSNRLETEARVAADEICGQNLTILDSFPPEMQYVTGGAYYRLLRYQRLAGKVEEGFEFCNPPIVPVDSLPPPTTNGLDSESNYPLNERIHSLADIICRSSDGKDFPSHKVLLTLASPIIGRMIAGDEGSQKAGASFTLDGLPVLLFPEDSMTLRILIGLCRPEYSDASIAVEELFVLEKIRDAMWKYEMAGAMKILEQQWSHLVAADPLRAFLLAANNKSLKEARQAVLQLLDKTMEDYYVPLLEGSSASTYRDALLYYRACKTAAREEAQTCRSGADASVNQLVGQEAHHIPRTSARCHGHLGGYYHNTCNGAAYFIYYASQNSGSSTPVCGYCTMLAQLIVHVIKLLDSPSSPLLTTLNSLNNSFHQQGSPCLVLQSPLEQDWSSIHALYKSLYDKLIDKVNQASLNHINV
ncbi:hypothetical protein DAEQUDRAFT_765631 [Daedalea quercina L-15889]|uniref:BTB domain-containing protein n=1 Tax=Daedalea quercina L-15889 TaxID=1314783 RepID=A0A165QDZ7_9APHY|nr:hypothetical protein DAEQUDRAFT_765631 [Daedalea quercina L-15889]